MNCSRLSKKENFKEWDPEMLAELRMGEFKEQMGDKLLVENEQLNIWLIELSTEEQLGFRKIINDFCVMPMEESYILNYQKGGNIFLVNQGKGDACYIQGSKFNEQHVWNLKNISLVPLKMIVLEFKYAETIREKIDVARLIDDIKWELEGTTQVACELLEAFIKQSISKDFLHNQHHRKKIGTYCFNIGDNPKIAV